VTTLVLADDDDDLRAVYVAALHADGYTVWEAADGREAIAMVRRHRPDVLLLDLWMPFLNGFEVLDQLRHDPNASRLKVVMFSVQADGDSRLESFGGGAVDYLVKGLALTDFRARLRRILAEAPIASDPS
jgi:CheY-like chemotaxis protein